MKVLLRGLAAACVLLFAGIGDASAQSVRTFVKTTGNDSFPCSLAQPCRTVSAAVAAVATGGEVIILDSGAFGSGLLIQKSVSISAEPGVTARLRGVNGGPAIEVNQASIVVSLRNLYINTDGTGYGIFFADGKSLTIRDSEIDGSGSNAYLVYHYAVNGHFMLFDSVLRNASVCLAAIGASTLAVLNRTTVTECDTGIYAQTGSKIAVSDSVISGNDGSRCYASINALNGGQIAVDRSTLSHCFYGAVSENSGSVVVVADSLLASNGQPGIIINGGVGQKSGNRYLANGTNAIPGFTTATTR